MNDNSVNVPLKRLSTKADIPSYTRAGDAAMDLHSSIDVTLKPFERALIPCGFAMALPEGFAAFVLPRSGLAIKQGISVVNSPGLIDSNYRGEIKVILINLDPEASVEIKENDRIAQMLIMPVSNIHMTEVSALDETNRGIAGFGSSGN